MTATNIFYNFVGFRYSPPKAVHVRMSRSFIIVLDICLALTTVRQKKNNNNIALAITLVRTS